ncbi:MAG: ANTAR domain-containing protein [Pseudobutyrivibrio sp.]|nr:ANTAR domain-containing protein [Pseudobutyrivibrio sp.]
MDRALVVCDSEKGTQFFKNFLKENGIIDIVVAENGPLALRRLTEYDFDVCIINGPIQGMTGEQLSIDIAEKNICQVILFIKAELIEEITEKVENYGVITVSKPINKQMFWSALKLAKVVQTRITMAHKESEKLEQKLEDMKLISRAKILLVEHVGISEQDAHKYIEKTAMDSRQSRGDVAREIIKKYT